MERGKRGRGRERAQERARERQKQRKGGGHDTNREMALITDSLGHYQSTETPYKTIINGEHQSARG